MPQDYWDRMFDDAEAELRRVAKSAEGKPLPVKRDGIHLIVRRAKMEYHMWMHEVEHTASHRVFEFSSVAFPHLAGVPWRVGGPAAEPLGWRLGTVREDAGSERSQVAAIADEFAWRHGFR